MNLFDPPPHEPTIFTPRDWARRVCFDLVLGVALGVGAACAFFALNWVGAGAERSDSPFSVWMIACAVGVGDALVTVGLRELMKRQPRATWLLTFYRRLRAAGFAIFIAWVALLVSQRLSRLMDRDFETLVGLSAVIGLVWVVALRAAWREGRARVVPWVVAAASLYVAADWAVKLGPSMERFSDPRANIAFYTIAGCGAYVVCAILAALDWMIAVRTRVSEAN